MSATDRQNRLLVAEDWKRIYQSFRNADFQSYDFDNLRRVMINYLRENYPEDFNDYIESSEYLALIDLIAFLGQSISFRIDMNARDNFLELAERRESVLRLARLLSYNPKRNIAGSGLLKFSSVATTQAIFDSNGRSLAGQTVVWNDTANSNWYDQFIKVLNAALPATRQFGNPDDKATIQGINTEQYRFQAANLDVPIYSFTKAVDGRSMDFEIVSTTFKDANEIYEEAPLAGNRLAFVYRNDNRGNGSANTGFFVHFKQGVLNQGTFTIDQPSTNETVDIDAVNINNSDVWLYRLDQSGIESEQWAQVPSLEGNNIIYNSLKKSIKNIYGVITRANDKVSLIFSDGTFGNLPRGTFRTYYRVSNGISYTINPKDVRNVSISIPYVSNVGQVETLTLSLNLLSSVGNASEAESSNSIKARAPATYYTQNRMITAEDYNISPLSVSQDVIKVKSVNRSASGISRYFDLVDPTGKYSKVNLFANDGALYKEEYLDAIRFKYNSKTDIEGVVYNQIIPKLKDPALRDFYYSRFPKKTVTGVTWFRKTVDTNLSTGYVGNTESGAAVAVGSTVETSLSFLRPDALVKFTAPVEVVDGIVVSYSYFDRNNSNQLVTGIDSFDKIGLVPNATTELWCKVISVTGDGTGVGIGAGLGELADASGTISLNDIVPSGAVISQVIAPWQTTLSLETIASMIGIIYANKPFGLRYDVNSLSWKIVTEVNLDVYGEFSFLNEGSTISQQKDTSWLVAFTTDTEYYTAKFRFNRYVFESDNQIRFYFDSSDNIYDIGSNNVVKDTINVLSVNLLPDTIRAFTYDRVWEISSEYIGLDGYVDTKKVQVTFNDSDNDGVVDNPNIFSDIVGSSYVVLQRYEVFQGQEDYKVFDNSNGTVVICESESDLYTSGNYFYKTNQLRDDLAPPPPVAPTPPTTPIPPVAPTPPVAPIPPTPPDITEARYQNNLPAYEAALNEYEANLSEYEASLAIYSADMAIYDFAVARYNANVEIYVSTITAYQQALAAYEAALYNANVTKESYSNALNVFQSVYGTAAGDAADSKYAVGQYFYFKDTGLVKKFTTTSPVNTLDVSLDYKVYVGRDKLKFQYIHNADYDSRIDPGITNIVDVYVLTKQYDVQFRQWILGSVAEEPLPPSSDSLYNMLSAGLNQIKSISDEVIYHPVKYKLLFGNNADENLRATFKVTKNPSSVISDNDVKSKTLAAINEFFSLENWDFGDSFYFSELSAYVMSRLAPNIVNFVIVPRKTELMFGNLFEIRAEKDQIFVNGAAIDDIEIISTITTSNIKGSSAIITALSSSVTQSVTSSGNI